MNAAENALFITGLCGGFTTFSSFANDALGLGNRSEILLSIIYICASVICGILLVWAGRSLIR